MSMNGNSTENFQANCSLGVGFYNPQTQTPSCQDEEEGGRGMQWAPHRIIYRMRQLFKENCTNDSLESGLFYVGHFLVTHNTITSLMETIKKMMVNLDMDTMAKACRRFRTRIV
jgi:hypothetical protein